VTSTERIRAKYDQLADRYEELFFYVADAGRRLLEYADPAPGDRVLDVGAGRGAVARAALARGCAVTAVDASAGMVARLAADFPLATARQMDAGRLDLPDGSFELVTAGFVLQVLDDPAAALAEFRRVLAPGGMFAMSLERQAPGRLAWLHELNAEFFTPPAPAGAPPEPQKAPMVAVDVSRLLTEGGFVDQHVVEVEMPLPLDDPDALWAWLGQQGVHAAVDRLPAARAAEFRARFYTSAARMDAEGGIVLEFAATLHRARTRG
jgi:SAM-dependent methyltransferase